MFAFMIDMHCDVKAIAFLFYFVACNTIKYAWKRTCEYHVVSELPTVHHSTSYDYLINQNPVTWPGRVNHIRFLSSLLMKF